MSPRLLIIGSVAALGLASALMGAGLGRAEPPAAAPTTPPNLGSKPVLTLHAAGMVLEASVAYARTRAGTGAVAVVDDSGSLVIMQRLDGTFPAASEVAAGKARTAAIFRKPTRAFEESINSGRVAMTAMHGYVFLQGGVPIVMDGQVVGAVGVSGAASAKEDDEVAGAGAAALTSSR